MAEKPLVLSTDEAKAIIDERKIMIRRVIKPQPKNIKKRDNKIPLAFWAFFDDEDKWIKPPYQPNDTLWVKEMWLKIDCFGSQNGYMYKANEKQNKIVFENTGQSEKWQPASRMPRAAARIFLKVTDTNAEKNDNGIWEWDMGMGI